MYPIIYRNARLFMKGGLERRKLQSELERSQWFSLEELDIRKLAGLRKLVKYAFYNVPYYHNLYSSVGIHPEDVKALKDFEALPFIRYKLNDMAIRQSEVCQCGRGMPVLKEIVGRKSDFIVMPGGDLYSDDFVEILQVKPEVARYQAYQPDLEHLEVRIVCKSEVDSAWLENVCNELQLAFASRIQISIKVVDAIELTRAGKHRVVISDVASGFIK